MKQSMLDSAVDAWQKARDDWGIEVEAPFVIRTSVATPESALAYAPVFGSPMGMMVDAACAPYFRGNREVRKYADPEGCYYSVLNIAQYQEYDRPRFVELLQDWGISEGVVRTGSDRL